MLTKHFQLHPYQIIAEHQFYETQCNKRIEYCHWFKDFISVENREYMLDIRFYIWEGWFHLFGNVNSHNRCIWSVNNLHEMLQQPLHDEKIEFSVLYHMNGK